MRLLLDVDADLDDDRAPRGGRSLRSTTMHIVIGVVAITNIGNGSLSMFAAPQNNKQGSDLRTVLFHCQTWMICRCHGQ
jgi:hypothetical protein